MPNVDVDVTERAEPVQSTRHQGAGEGRSNAVGAAIASAVDDALGRTFRLDHARPIILTVCDR